MLGIHTDENDNVYTTATSGQLDMRVFLKIRLLYLHYCSHEYIININLKCIEIEMKPAAWQWSFDLFNCRSKCQAPKRTPEWTQNRVKNFALKGCAFGSHAGQIKLLSQLLGLSLLSSPTWLAQVFPESVESLERSLLRIALSCPFDTLQTGAYCSLYSSVLVASVFVCLLFYYDCYTVSFLVLGFWQA